MEEEIDRAYQIMEEEIDRAYSMHGRKCIQGFGGKTLRKYTTLKT
jgi:hypothetical protein